MFSKLSPRTAIFIDYSNIFYAKYTVGWFFDLEKLLDYCEQAENISLIWCYWATDNKKLAQYNRTQRLSKKYTSSKHIMYWKLLEQHGSKSKGNVDTEMGFDLSEHKDAYDTLVLFSGDWDFAYPIRALIAQGKKVIICSTKGHVSWLINLTQEYGNGECVFLDFNHEENPDSIEMREIIKDTKQWLALSTELQTFITSASKVEIKELSDFLECMINKEIYNNGRPSFMSIVDKNNFPIYKNIARRNNDESLLLVEYLKNFL